MPDFAAGLAQPPCTQGGVGCWQGGGVEGAISGLGGGNRDCIMRPSLSELSRLFTLLALQEKESINASEEVNKVIREVTVELPKQTYSGQVNNLLEVSF